MVNFDFASVGINEDEKRYEKICEREEPRVNMELKSEVYLLQLNKIVHLFKRQSERMTNGKTNHHCSHRQRLAEQHFNGALRDDNREEMSGHAFLDHQMFEKAGTTVHRS
ncbi:hypothetical protein LOAG_07673 [Loa loa]|uniref:Uncharacterized protein n=1 Tax=Loa loa TaxID=7209 RepID=A0A1S0TV47_LOALO|nr:hypothetical protein LOAG_07673 [Loa loa]EFO20815.1 hypothetical protein LOAG_07673 [Loa loa]